MSRRLLVLLSLCTCLLLMSGLASAAEKKKVTAASIDNFANALKVSANMTYVVSKAHTATYETGENIISGCGQNDRPSVWFKFKADRGMTLMLNTRGTFLNYTDEAALASDDTVLSVYEMTQKPATFNTLMPVACNNNANGQVGYSEAMVYTKPNTWYYIRVKVNPNLPIPTGSKFVLNIHSTNLVEHTPTAWIHSGKGKADDNFVCSSLCGVDFFHTIAGKSKLTQVIDSFKGVNLQPGHMLRLTVAGYRSGNDQNFQLKMTVTYTDGTQVTRKATVHNNNTRATGDIYFEAPSLTLQKPVKSITVTFTDKIDFVTSSWVSIGDMEITVYRKQDAAVLSLPPAPASAQ